MPSAMSVNMLGWRVRIDAHPRSKNGHPAQRTTGVDETRPIQLMTDVALTSMAEVPTKTVVCQPRNTPNMSAMASTNTGAPIAAAIQRRRVMSTSSGFGPSSAETVIGSRAIPHFGQAPGPCWTTSGCMGHVYSASLEAPCAAWARGFRKDSGSALKRVRQDGLQK